ncbi:Gp37-like protein, partial [Clostridioides difficile]|uniref:Gp37-like protein n=1 Tax=Clostridioides difficile TaxID=1496 RepID=UPI003AA9729A
MIKAFVNNNCVDSSNPKRVIDNLIISENKNLGSADMWRSSYENLSDKIQEISEFCGLGWEVVLDANK